MCEQPLGTIEFNGQFIVSKHWDHMVNALLQMELVLYIITLTWVYRKDVSVGNAVLSQSVQMEPVL